MRDLLAAAACAAVIALAVPSVAADEAMDRQIRQIASLTEITQLAVVKMRRAEPEADEADAPAGQMSFDDLLLSGFGERRMMTAEDEDDFDIADADEAPDVMAGSAEIADPGAPAVGNGLLMAAIEDNAVLAQALAERNVDFAQVVSVEVRDGTTVIVYLDETRG